jgi:hypothetical protein
MRVPAVPVRDVPRAQQVDAVDRGVVPVSRDLIPRGLARHTAMPT